MWAVDEIATPDGLRAWLEDRGLVAAGMPVDPGAFVRARALRDVLRELARRNAHGEAPDDALRSAFGEATAAVRLRLDLGADGVLALAPDDRTVDGALGRIVASVYDAQVAGVWRRLKSCPGDHCGWLFYDGSRNASSRWCSMSICGNRTKTAAYRRRRRTA